MAASAVFFFDLSGEPSVRQSPYAPAPLAAAQVFLEVSFNISAAHAVDFHYAALIFRLRSQVGVCLPPFPLAENSDLFFQDGGTGERLRQHRFALGQGAAPLFPAFRYVKIKKNERSMP